MKKVLFLRTSSGDQGTFGIFASGSFSCRMVELPWRDNKKQLSCIPEGTYEVRWKRSPKFGWCYQVIGVPGRGNILLHSGNYAGDVTLKYLSNSYGCLLPCRKVGILGKQRAGLLSRPAVNALNSYFNKETFFLEIKNAYPSDQSV